MSYAIISVGGKQYRVKEGERLTVDRLAVGEGNTFAPPVLLVGGDGATRIAPTDVTVTARVVANTMGEKIRIGKYKPKSGYRKHTGFRASLSEIEIESIGGTKQRSGKASERKPEAEPTGGRSAEAPTPPEVETPRVVELAAGSAAEPPAGYEELTVAAIKEQSGEWNRPMLEAALEYERGHGNRKGAVAALESALAAKESE